MSQDKIIESYDRVDDHLSVKQALKAWQVRTLHDSPNSLLFVYVARILTFQVSEEGSMPSQGTKTMSGLTWCCETGVMTCSSEVENMEQSIGFESHTRRQIYYYHRWCSGQTYPPFKRGDQGFKSLTVDQSYDRVLAKVLR
jgi:hypothetical protein